MTTRFESDVITGTVIEIPLTPAELADIAADRVNLKPRARRHIRSLARGFRSALFDENFDQVFQHLLIVSTGGTPSNSIIAKAQETLVNLQAILAERRRLIDAVDALPEDANLDASIQLVLSDQRWP